MLFRELLTKYREASGFTKSQLAEKLGITPEYIVNVESGHNKRPPTLDRCNEIARALSLSSEDRQRLIDAAMEERLPQEALEWHLDKMKSFNLKNGKLEEAGEMEFVRVPLYTLEQAAKIKKSSPLPRTSNYVSAPLKRGTIMIAVNYQNKVVVVDLEESPRPGDLVLVGGGKIAKVEKFTGASKEIAIIGVVVLTMEKHR